MAFYEKHLFFCTNVKKSGERCCGQAQSQAMKDFAKNWLVKAGLHGKGQNRVSTSGCLGRCKEGPCLLVYPEGTWYTYQNEADIERILQKEVGDGSAVEDLLLER